jgi:uncharacterized protein YjbJ (UPF0337 family)
MTDDRIKGAVRKGVGHVQDAVGGLTGDEKTQIEGKLNQAAGSVQNAYGKTLEAVSRRSQDALGEVESFAKEQPLAAVAISLALGFMLGLMVGRAQR